MASRRIRSSLAAFAIAGLSLAGGEQNAAWAQPGVSYPDGVPPDVFSAVRRAGGDTIAFCVNAGSILADFERDLAQDIADSLLVGAEIIDVIAPMPVSPYDFRLPLIDSEVYYYMAVQCDAFMGFSILADYPPWLTISPVYLTTRTVLAVDEPGYDSLEDLPDAARIGTRMLSLADGALAAYLAALPHEGRWERVLHSSHATLLDALAEGAIDAALVWEPAVLRYQADHPDAPRFHTISEFPFPVLSSEFAMALRPQEDFFNGLLGEVILRLPGNGAIDDLAIAHGVLPRAGD